MITGGCFCGHIRFEITHGEYKAGNCHCSMCRRASGAPFVSWLIGPAPEFRYTQGEAKRLDSSKQGTRWFCPDCGTPIACVTTAHPDIVDVTIGSLDAPGAHPPTRDYYEDTRLHWVRTATRPS